MSPDILVFTYTYDRYEVLKQSLESMFRNPGMEFRLWVLDNGSAFFGPSGVQQLDLLLDYYRHNKIERLIINDKNYGIHYPINEILALAKLTSEEPKVSYPDFMMLTNDDMIYEEGWLKDCYQTFMDCESHKVGLVSPFHCKNSKGNLAHGMETNNTIEAGGRTYEIKRNVSGNTWFARTDTWLRIFDWYPINSPTEGGDWSKLSKLAAAGMTCAITPTEMAHHHPEAEGRGRFNRLGHW
jgi:GT2 family glycosyltransferase